MAIVYNAKEVNEKLFEMIKSDVADLKSKGINPALHTLRVGESGSDIAYENGIKKRFSDLGIEVLNHVYSLDITQDELMGALKAISDDDNVHGILMFQPLPKHLDYEVIKANLDPKKDVDGSCDANLSALINGKKGNVYCAPASVMKILEHYNVNLKGANVVIIGRGTTVGKPLAMLFINAQATVTVCNSQTKNLKEICKGADILVSAIGKSQFVDASFVSEGQIVIDVGTNYENGVLTGDVKFDEVEKIVKAITKTPGGVGAITTTILAINTVESANG